MAKATMKILLHGLCLNVSSLVPRLLVGESLAMGMRRLQYFLLLGYKLSTPVILDMH